MAIVFWMSVGAVARAETVTLRADVWCPFNCTPNTAKPGYMIEVATYAFAKAGIKIDYDVLPWERVVQEVSAGHYDGAVGSAGTDIEGGIVPKLPLGQTANVLLLKARNPFVYKGPQSLETLRIGAIKGYTYDGGGEIDRYIKQAEQSNSRMVEFVHGDEALRLNIRKLLADRVDAVLDDRSVLANFISLEMPRDPVRMVPIGEASALYIVFTPKNPSSARYARLLDDGLVELRKSGELAGILAKYGLSDWQ